MSSHGAATHDPEQSHPTAVPQSVTGHRFVGIFRTGRHMSAGIADKGGQRELIKPYQAGTEHPARRFAPWIGKIAGLALSGCRRTARMIFPATAHMLS